MFCFQRSIGCCLSKYNIFFLQEKLNFILKYYKCANKHWEIAFSSFCCISWFNAPTAFQRCMKDCLGNYKFKLNLNAKPTYIVGFNWRHSINFFCFRLSIMHTLMREQVRANLIYRSMVKLHLSHWRHWQQYIYSKSYHICSIMAIYCYSIVFYLCTMQAWENTMAI